jgi:DNA-binding transcriptional LysR family regulator
MRNLDVTTLRSFAAVADHGGVTRAAGVLHLTQSAVSMQLKRLEEMLDIELLDRSKRSIALTAAGEQLLGYARRILELNDKAVARLTAEEFEGEITVGLPHDIIQPYLPPVLRQFSQRFPRMQVHVTSSHTQRLREMFARGEVDMVLTTEEEPGPDGEILVQIPLRWIGAVGGSVWKQSPLPIAFCANCIFRSDVLRRVSRSGIAWRMVHESEHDGVVDAVVSADLGVTAFVEGSLPPHTEIIDHKGALPDLGQTRIILYTHQGEAPAQLALRDLFRRSYRSRGKIEGESA